MADLEPKALMAALDRMMPPMPEGYEDWEYRDTQSWLREDFWGQFLTLLGDGNYKVLAMSSRVMDGGRYNRGQFWISPRGMANLIAHNATIKDQTNG